MIHAGRLYNEHVSRQKFLFLITYYPGKGKGKAIPLQAWTGLEGSRRLRLSDLMTIGT